MKTRNEILVGRTIQSFQLNDERTELMFNMADGGKVLLETEADCCSETWIEGIDNEDALVGGTIRLVEDIDMPGLGDVPSPNHPEAVDVVAYYGMKIETNRGTCVLDYRNSSNGYYGGWLNAREIDRLVTEPRPPLSPQ